MFSISRKGKDQMFSLMNYKIKKDYFKVLFTCLHRINNKIQIHQISLENIYKL